VIKPALSHTEQRVIVGKVLRVESAEDLLAWYHKSGSCWDSLVVQEMIPGGDEALWTVGAYLNADSRPLGIFCGHKLRQYPPRFGTCSLGECAWEPRVVRLGLRLLRGIGYVGPTQVEFKYDPRDGEFKLMEINARTWLWHTLATDGEVDLAYMMYLDQIGEPCAPRVLGKPGARWLSLIADTASARRYMQEGELSWRAWLGSWRGVQKLDLLSFQDPLPFVTVLRNVARRQARAME
jgi:predicted ATP-grasp superfamily ATP-dependent carboligase